MPPRVQSIEVFKQKVQESLSEDQIQQSVIAKLTQLYYIALQTTHRYKKPLCNRCGSRNDFKCGCGGKVIADPAYGASEGVSDLLVTAEWWPNNMWLCVEIKKNKKAAVRPAQQELRDRGRTVVCWTVEMVLDAVREFERLNNLRGGEVE